MKGLAVKAGNSTMRQFHVRVGLGLTEESRLDSTPAIQAPRCCCRQL